MSMKINEIRHYATMLMKNKEVSRREGIENARSSPSGEVDSALRGRELRGWIRLGFVY